MKTEIRVTHVSIMGWENCLQERSMYHKYTEYSFLISNKYESISSINISTG